MAPKFTLPHEAGTKLKQPYRRSKSRPGRMPSSSRSISQASTPSSARQPNSSARKARCMSSSTMRKHLNCLPRHNADGIHSGVMNCPVELVTDDGYDLQWGTNVLGHFYFTKLLLPALEAGAKSSPDGHARVITTSSAGSYLGTISPETFKDGPPRRKRFTERLYFQSKLVRTPYLHVTSLAAPLTSLRSLNARGMPLSLARWR